MLLLFDRLNTCSILKNILINIKRLLVKEFHW